MDAGGQVDTFILDFEKAFDTPQMQNPWIWHKWKKTLVWIELFLSNRQKKSCSQWSKISVGTYIVWCAAWHVLGPLLFSLYINDTMVGIESEIRLFANDCVCYRQIDSIEDTSNSKKILINWANGPGNGV